MTNIIKNESDQQNINHLRCLAKIAAESKQYATMTETQLFNLMLSAKDLGISPMKAINGGFYIVNGKVCMATSLMADRIRREGHSIKVIEMSKEKCVIVAIRKDNGDSFKLEYTWEDASLAGLTNSPTWKRYPKNMLYNRCMSQVARILFPDVVGNSYSEEERFDIQNVAPEKRPLENADVDIAIAPISVSSSAELTVQQCAELDVLLLDLESGEIEKLYDALGVECIYEIPPKDFDRVVRSIKKKIKEKEDGSTNVA